MIPLVAPRREWLLALLAVVVVTASLLAVRESLDKTHVALAYLLVVLGVSSRGGRALGMAVSIAAFLCFNFFFLLPYFTLTVADPLNWTVLATFLLTSLVAARLLVRARSEAASAGLRAKEVERLSTLGAETLNAARAEDALRAIVDMIRTTLEATQCDVHVREGGGKTTVLVARAGSAPAPHPARALGQPSAHGIIDWVAANGRTAVELDDGSMRVADSAGTRDFARVYAANARTLVVPLHVRERTVGVLTIAPGRTLMLDSATQRFLEALSYYAALGVERLSLTKDAERAEALQKADEVKNAVLASVSHDLRTPLTTIKALAHEIRKEGDERAATIEEEADRLNRFVADLLDLSRLTGGALHVAPEINAAEDLIGAAMQRVSGAVGDIHVLASLDPSDPLLLGRFDFVHSLRVLGNLIDNAVKFAPPRSTVEVHARRQNGALEFVVADRGQGIPSSDREVIFQPFYRRPQGTPDASGVGLGLSIARGLAEAQGGSVKYEEREGGGSLFVFRVPAADASDFSERPEESL
jgi:two-component system sensor histidine kinase KdpD